MTPGEAFWRFSLAVYKQAGVPDECLALQDRLGIDVNLLLLCGYLGARKNAALTSADIAAAAEAGAQWHAGVVRNLRAARQALKPWSEGRDAGVKDAAGTLRNAVKTLELDSERIEHDLLARWAESRSFATAAADTAVASNIAALLAHYAPDGRGSTLSPRRLIAAALAQAG